MMDRYIDNSPVITKNQSLKTALLTVCYTLGPLALLITASSLSHAEYQDSLPKVSGFLNVGVTNNDNETTFLNYDNALEFQNDTLLGLQFDARLDKKLRTSAQVIAKNNAGNFDLDTEWAYIGYTVNPQLEIKAGRLRVPNFLFSETIHVGASYPWLRPPPEVYNLFQTTQLHGIDFSYSVDIKGSTLYFQPYAGEIHSQGSSFKSGTDEFFGLRTRLETPNFEYIVSFVHATGTIDIDNTGSGGSIDTTIQFCFDMFTIGIMTEINNTILISEYSRNHNTGQGTPDTSGWYGTVVYPLEYFSPYITLALRDDKLSTGNSKDDLRENKSLSLGGRVDLSPGAAITLELQHAEAQNDTSGLFGNSIGSAIKPTDDAVNLISLRFDTVF